MNIKLQKYGIIEMQDLEIGNENIVIYGYNNCGKTSALRAIDKACNKAMLESMLIGEESIRSLYIPTNRVVIRRDTFTEKNMFGDIEDFVNYKNQMYIEYDLHLKMIRDYFLRFEVVRKFMISIINKLFDIEISDFSVRLSDGIENIINVYLNIFWVLVRDNEVILNSEEQFTAYIKENSIIVLIDEMEIFLHVCVQSRLLDCLKNDFPKCKFVITTHSPLLLTRCQNLKIYRLVDGVMQRIDNNLYYKDLDSIFEICFNVNEIPTEIGTYINYLGKVLMQKEQIDKNRIWRYVKILETEYKNIYDKYRVLVTKVIDLLEE